MELKLRDAEDREREKQRQIDRLKDDLDVLERAQHQSRSRGIDSSLLAKARQFEDELEREKRERKKDAEDFLAKVLALPFCYIGLLWWLSIEYGLWAIVYGL